MNFASESPTFSWLSEAKFSPLRPAASDLASSVPGPPGAMLAGASRIKTARHQAGLARAPSSESAPIRRLPRPRSAVGATNAAGPWGPSRNGGHIPRVTPRPRGGIRGLGGSNKNAPVGVRARREGPPCKR